MRLCLFSSWFIGAELPHAVRRYLEELRRHFDQVILVTNDDNDLSAERPWFEAQRIDLRQVRNEGYDFGMWHKLLVPMDIAPLERLALVNDSCVLFAPLAPTLAWMEQSVFDACGITDSLQHGYHLQSYFLYFKRAPIAAVRAYFERQGLATGGFWDVVTTYELGLSRALAQQGYSLGARWSTRGTRFRYNAAMEYIVHLIRAGMPMIKRKAFRIELTYAYFRRQIHQIVNGYLPDPWRYVELIRQKHGLPVEETRRLFGPLLQEERRARCLNALWPPIYNAWRALRLPTVRIAALGG